MPDDARPSAKAPAPPPRRTPRPHPAGKAAAEPDFEEAAYLAAFPDVAQAVRNGSLNSALEHYRVAGQLERRLQRPEYRRLLGRSSPEPPVRPADPGQTAGPAVNLEAAFISTSGAVFLAGWTDDRQSALTAIRLQRGRDSRQSFTRVPRVRRVDVETALGASRPHPYGFWLFGPGTDRGVPALTECNLDLRFADGSAAAARRRPAVCTDTELRDLALSYLAKASYCGNRDAEAFANLDCGAGEALIGFNRGICRGIVAGATVSRFGPQRPRFRASIVVPLFGIGDYLFVQSCAYAQGRGIGNYEFIYVINSPELAEQLHREARIAEMIYGLTISLVTLPDNAGFGMANNAGVQFARSDRILCVNPDVFPRDPDWAQRHTELVASLPAERTRLFGASLFYDDGSLMHGGMYFEADIGILSGQGRVTHRPMLRVEHYGKGAPPWAIQYVASRPVPAVTGAFISIDRAWFDRLGGFSENYVFGHYEDADLCLKSLHAGTPVWLHDLPMWHLEGKGSRRLPQHEGGSLLNRWLFTNSWEPKLVPNLIGRNPRLITEQAEPVAAARMVVRPAAPARSTARIHPV